MTNVFFDEYNLLATFLISFVVQMIFFALAASFKTDKFTDLSYSLSFIILAWFNFLTNKAFSPVQILITVLITFWGLRLAGYLFTRILKIKKDRRFDGIRENVGKFAAFWFFQAISVWIIMIPATIILSLKTNESPNITTWLGSFIWLTGLSLETVADWQKFAFKNKPENKGKWINQGVWQSSRHPNYFGEMLCWWGLFLIAVPFLKNWLWLSVVGPGFITFILLFVSGIPPLEKKYDKRYASNQKYQEYKKRTSLLIPLPPKRT